MKFSIEKEQSIISDYLSGLNTVEIGKKWNTYNTSIRRVLLRNGITPRTTHEVRCKTVNPFKENDEYSEYFLGLLLTDGCISGSKNSPSINLSLKDKEIVEKFRQFLCSHTKLREYVHKKYGTSMYSAETRSKETAEYLQSKGQFVNKSYDCEIFCPITPSILRGIFDGDGGIIKRNGGNTREWFVCGASKKFIEQIHNYLTDNGINSLVRIGKGENRQHPLYYVYITKTIDVLKVGNLMYKGASIFLQRKYDNWHLWVEMLKEKCAKFKESGTPANPEPSFAKRFGKEGAETIMRYLKTID